MSYNEIDQYGFDYSAEKEKILGSLLYFTRVFFYLRTGRRYEISTPVHRQSHHVSICNLLEDVFYGRVKDFLIQIPPRYGKSELMISFVAWSMAHYPDCNNLYASYSLGLAKKQTNTIRQIMSHPVYQAMFPLRLSEDTAGKGNFETIQGGTVFAAGTGGEITGRGAGIQKCDRFGGLIIIDDMHKPIEVHSDTVRNADKEWFFNTLQSRRNDPARTPIGCIGQALHEDDGPSMFIKDPSFKTLIIPVEEEGHVLDENMHTLEMLRKMEKENPYVYAAQMMQRPLPSGGGIFKREWFINESSKELNILSTFITCDTAETSKTYNDATVFSFWGLYKVKNNNIETDLYALHWLNCWELRIEPNELEQTLINFYSDCCLFHVKPKYICIEKKSTGVTLSSSLSRFRGITVMPIDRTRADGSKTTRYLEVVPFLSSGQISIDFSAKHATMCLDHCRKITANNSHLHDDIADTLYDAVKIALIDGTILVHLPRDSKKDHEIARLLTGNVSRLKQIRGWK